MNKIKIGRGLFKQAGALMKEAGLKGKVAIISDETVSALYGPQLQDMLEMEGFDPYFHNIIPGEASKNLDNFGRIVGFLADRQFTRSDTVVALGGGVVGDIAGFAASAYLRGVQVVQIPTTLLACVDSSVGGKTGIDLPQGKNLVGAFWQPFMTIIDTDLLRSLPEDIYRDGLAEVIKYAAICDAGLYDMLPYDLSEEESVISRCISIKKGLVSRDERDKGERQLLNFGHSFGHAIERLSKYCLSHGSAVAIGMAIMANASQRMKFCLQEDAGRLIGMIRVLGLPTDCPYGADDIFEAMLLDKKRQHGDITLVMMHAMGDCQLHSLPLSEAYEVLKLGLSL